MPTWPARGEGDRQREAERQREQQRPADRLRPAERARERAALGVGERAQHGRDQQLDVGEPDRPEPSRRDEREHRDEPEAAASQNPREGDSPARSTANTAVQAAGSSADHDRAVGGVDAAQRERREEREADDDPERDDGERAPLGARGARRAQCRRTTAPSHRGHRGAAEGDEQRVEVGDREPRRRQREREDRDAERGEREAAQFCVAGRAPVELIAAWLGPAEPPCEVGRTGCRYRRLVDNVTLAAHTLE